MLVYRWKFYDWLNTWPIELRPEIRAALRSSRTEDHTKTEELFTKVYSKVRHFQPSLPLLHTTGLACVVAEHISKKMEAPDRALKILQIALGDMDAQPVGSLSDPERLRRLQLLYKMAQMSEDMKDQEGAEKYLERGVAEGLKGVAEMRRKKTGGSQGVEGGEEGQTLDVLKEEIVMPRWLSKVDLGATMEMLGRIYRERNKPEFAIPLYLTAVSILLPPSAAGNLPKDVTVRDRCAAGMMMNNLADSIVMKPTTENITNARLWARKAADVTEAAIRSDDGAKLWGKKGEELQEAERETIEQCDFAKAVALFNVGVLSGMAKEPAEAQKYLQHAIRFAKQRGMVEVAQTAEESLEQIQSTSA